MTLGRTFAGSLVAALIVAPGVRAEDGKLDEAARTSAVNGVLRLLDESYVFPDVAKAMDRAIRERMERKEYDALDGPRLASALTRDLQAVSHDLHLRVQYSPETLPPEPEGNPMTPPPEAMEEMRKQLARDNYGFKKVEILDGNLGYIRLDVFAPPEFAGDTYTAAMNFVASTDALIIDLRYNGGSIHPDAVPLMCSYFFDKPTHINGLYWRAKNKTDEYYTLAEVPGKKYLDRPVYLLTSRRTFSGAEEFAYDLKNLKRATLVGDTTGGGANPGGDRRVNDHFTVWVPMGRAINPITKTNWEGTGVTPDLAVPSAKALVEARIAALRQVQSRATDPRQKEALTDAIASAERDATRFKRITFTLKDHPKAKQVFVAGSFNGWSDRSHPLTRQGDAWVGEVDAEPGTVTYKFIVDGEWMLDPANTQTEREGRHENSVRQVD